MSANFTSRARDVCTNASSRTNNLQPPLLTSCVGRQRDHKPLRFFQFNGLPDEFEERHKPVAAAIFKTAKLKQRSNHSYGHTQRFGSGDYRNGGSFDDIAVEAYRQGQLDHLCGIYAIINAINLASNGHVIDQNWAMTIVASILPIATELASDEVEGFIGLSSSDLTTIAKIILHGLSAAGLHYQLISPQKYFRHSGEKHLSKRQILRRATPQPESEVSSGQTTYGSTHGTRTNQSHALIMQLRTPMCFHWTVLKGKKGRSVELFDSTNLHRTKIKYCRPWKIILQQ